MKNEQKQTILAGKVPVGYKQTEVGIIPEDWEVKPLHYLVISNGLVRGPFGGALKKEIFVKAGYKVYEQRNAIYSNWEMGDYYVTKSKFDELNRFAINAGDFVVSCSGTIGRIYQIPDDAPVGIINQALLKITINEKINAKYFLHYFRWDVFQNKIIDSTQGGAMKNLIGMSEFRNSLISLPPLKEQTAIAEALSDVDSLLVSLEKLIEKKRAIKTGTMQQLLTGKKRLPAFAQREDGTPKGYKTTELGEIPEDWEVKTVFELANNQKELFNDGDWIESEHITSDGIRLIQTGNIGIGKFIENEQHKKYIFEESFFKLNCKPLRNGDILICRLADPAGRSCIYETDSSGLAITSVDVTIFRPDQNVDRNFFVQYFSSSEWFQAVLQSVGGTTHKRISRGALGKILVPVPPFKEQTAIAEILSDMDAEIEALEAKRAKTEEIKQGMMQELLTGRTRLI